MISFRNMAFVFFAGHIHFALEFGQIAACVTSAAKAFRLVGLEPRLGSAWRDWVPKECAVDPALVVDIEHRIAELNDQIVADARFGKQFQIGYSYVTPAHRLEGRGHE